MKKNSQLIAIGLLTLALGVTLFYEYIHTLKVAFVKSNDLVYGYTGMIEAQKQLESKKANLVLFDIKKIKAT